MARQLPSLNGLRAFEAAGRLGSFKAAAQELNVTQTAVSHMVRLLEDRLGYAVFLRKPNRLELTVQGRVLLAGLTDSLDAIARLADQVAAMRTGPVLTVGVGPTLAVSWLIPRLANFYRSHPDIEVRMATGARPAPCETIGPVRSGATLRHGRATSQKICSRARLFQFAHQQSLRTCGHQATCRM